MLHQTYALAFALKRCAGLQAEPTLKELVLEKKHTDMLAAAERLLVSTLPPKKSSFAFLTSHPLRVVRVRKDRNRPKPPKGPRSAYIFFLTAQHQTFRSQGSRLSPAEKRALISQNWRALSDKSEFARLSVADKRRHSEEFAKFQADNPTWRAAPRKSKKAADDSKRDDSKMSASESDEDSGAEDTALESDADEDEDEETVPQEPDPSDDAGGDEWNEDDDDDGDSDWDDESDV